MLREWGLSRIVDVFVRYFCAEPPLAESVADRSDLAEPVRFLLRLVRWIESLAALPRRSRGARLA